MTPLIDTIEKAFIAEREQAEWAGGEVRCTLVVEAIELASKADDSDGELEWIVSVAYAEARHVYGNEWTLYPGHVAELVADGLREWVGS